MNNRAYGQNCYESATIMILTESQSMSQLELNEFDAALSELIDGRSTNLIISHAKNSLGDKINKVSLILQDLGIAQRIQRLRSRHATLPSENGADLFDGYELPLTSKLAKSDSLTAKNKRTEVLTKAEVRHKRDELAQLPRRQQKLLHQYTKLYTEIDGHCADDETVRVGLARARG